jgi:hypothetical protein
MILNDRFDGNENPIKTDHVRQHEAPSLFFRLEDRWLLDDEDGNNDRCVRRDSPQSIIIVVVKHIAY